MGRANGSRERAPDDRLRETHHSLSIETGGYRFAPPALQAAAFAGCCVRTAATRRPDLNPHGSIGAERVPETQHGLGTLGGSAFFSQQCGSFPWMPCLTHVHASHFSS